MRILIVDDFPMLIAVLRKILLDLGFHAVSEVHSGEQAIVKLKAAVQEGEPYEVMFADWYMPEISGIELIELCRKTPELRGTAIIMVSAEREHVNMDRALKAGAFDYIMKPMGEEALGVRIRGILGRLHKLKTANAS